jgi:hypothetical protein
MMTWKLPPMNSPNSAFASQQHRKAQGKALRRKEGAERDNQRGHRSAHDENAVDQADHQSEAKRSCNTHPDRQVILAGDDRHGQSAGRDGRADGNVEFPGYHQQAHRDCDDTEIGGNVQPAGCTRRLQKVGAAEDDEENQDCDKTEKCSRLGTAQEIAN